MRRLTAAALFAIAITVFSATAHAEGAQSAANTPRLALNKVELWLANAEPKPSIADIDAGVAATTAAEERMAMLNTEMGAVASRRRTLQLQAVAARRKIAELRAERDAPKGENGVKARPGIEQKILELANRADALDAQAETLYGYMQRIGHEEKGIVDAVGRVRGVADMIETSSLADARQKQRATVLASKTSRTFRLHAAMIMTLMQATQAGE